MIQRTRVWTLIALSLAWSFPLSAGCSRNTDGVGVPAEGGEAWSDVGPYSPEGWKEFLTAVTFLQNQGDRDKAAELFRTVVRDFPHATYVDPSSIRRKYADEAGELAELLETMVAEDDAWTEPDDLSQLGVEGLIQYNIYHLRNVNCYQVSQPSWCSVLDESTQRPGHNAAVDLLRIGEPAIPALIEILDDRRPLRSVAYHRSFWPCRTVLRYRDAAIEILHELLPIVSTWATLSRAQPGQREGVVPQIRRWYNEAKNRPPEEQLWLAVQYADVYPAVEFLRSLGLKHGQKQRALSRLDRMYEACELEHQPWIAKAMADLGDPSRIREVVDSFRQGKYPRRSHHWTAMPLSAHFTATQIIWEYGSGRE